MNQDPSEQILTELKKFWAVLQQPIFSINNSKITISSLAISVLVVVAATFIAKHLGRIINRTLANRNVDSGVRDSLEKFFRYTMIAMGVLFALDNLGISVNSLAASARSSWWELVLAYKISPRTSFPGSFF